MNGAWKQLSVGLAAAGVVAGAAIVWGQTTERIETVESRQAVIEREIAEIRRTQQEQSAALAGLKVGNVHILNAIQRLDRRLERSAPGQQ